MEDGESHKQRKIRNIIFNVRHIFQPFRLRCVTEMDDRCDRWLLEWNFHFLPIVSFLLYVIFLLF